MLTASLFLSCRSHPFKHRIICEQKLPVSADALWWRLTADGDSAGVRPGAKSGEKPGATLPGACFFFYLFSLLLPPALPLPGHDRGHGAPIQPGQRQQRPPQRQLPALQTQTLSHFFWTTSLHLQQVRVALKAEFKLVSFSGFVFCKSEAQLL